MDRSARPRVFVALAAAIVACGGAPPRSPAPNTSDVGEATRPEGAEAGPTADGARSAVAPRNTIPEIEARVILAEMFREAGCRILYDVPVALGPATVAIDGFDPDKKLGFEYRAAAELAAWSGKVPDGAGVRILVIDATDRDTVEARARAFLQSVE